MKTRLFALAMVLSITSPLWADAVVGKSAPDFSLPASDGKTYQLANFKGKFVVLEWFNKDCPFIRKHYDSGNMQKLQEKFTGKGVVWFSIASSAPGKEGFMTSEEAAAQRVTDGSHSTATLLDPQGVVGRSYGAKCTPHMFIIDPQGKVIYNGAIDDHNSTDQEDIAVSTNYVSLALSQAMNHLPVTNPTTHPYGCSVKYQ